MRYLFQYLHLVGTNLKRCIAIHSAIYGHSVTQPFITNLLNLHSSNTITQQLNQQTCTSDSQGHSETKTGKSGQVSKSHGHLVFTSSIRLGLGESQIKDLKNYYLFGMLHIEKSSNMTKKS